MEFLELDADIVNNAIATRTNQWEIDSLKAILLSGDFGCVIERNGKQTNYGIMLDGTLVASVLLFMHGDGKLKTIKLTELIVKDDLPDIQKLTVIVSCVSGIISLSKTVLDSGNTVRAMKIYGRKEAVFDGLQVIATQISEEFGKAGIGVSLEGRWLSFSTI
jgi:hypothetical protein